VGLDKEGGLEWLNRSFKGL